MTIEEIVITYLSDCLDVAVSAETPDKKTGEYVLVEKTGSQRVNHINQATLAIKSHADRLLDAAKLNERVKACMDGIIQLDCISSCRLDTDYNFTDTSTKKYRYQAVFTLVFF